MLEATSLALLAAVLLAAAVRPRGVPEAVVAVPAALLLVGVGAVSWADTWDEISRLGPVVGFLAAVLVLADACAAEGLFVAAGAQLARRARGSGRRLLVGVVVVAAVTTAVLSLDTTVVLLTPVVAATARTAGLRQRPPLYACAHLANSASLLLPVSNLTNLLAFAAVPISFGRFAVVMALPWLVAVAVDLAAHLVLFRRDVTTDAARTEEEAPPVPRFALAVVLVTLALFVVASSAGVDPVWPAVAGAVLVAGRRVVGRSWPVVEVARAAAPAFCIFVLALGVVVRAAADNGLASVVRHVLPVGASLPTLLGIAALAAVAANIMNNLPATLLLLPVAAHGGTAAVLAVLVGVDVGPNLTYAGSLATLLWRRVVPQDVGVPTLREFTLLGVMTVPLTLVAATVALWLAVRVVGV